MNLFVVIIAVVIVVLILVFSSKPVAAIGTLPSLPQCNNTTNKCPSGQYCAGNGFCTAGCSSSSDCANSDNGTNCLSTTNSCGCTEDTDCTSSSYGHGCSIITNTCECGFKGDCDDGYYCNNGRCAIGQCGGDGECSTGQYCNLTTKTCATGCSTSSECVDSDNGTNCLSTTNSCGCTENTDCTNSIYGQACLTSTSTCGCNISNPCLAGYYCNNGACAIGCGNDNDCNGQVCVNHGCIDGCDENNPCPSGLYCNNNICLKTFPDGMYCMSGTQCTGGYCNKFKCMSNQPGEIGASCNDATDCNGLYCTNNICSSHWLSKPGEPCSLDSQCLNNSCDLTSNKCADVSSSPSLGDHCDPSVTPSVSKNEICMETVYGSGEYNILDASAFKVNTAFHPGPCYLPGMYVQPSSGNTTRCYYPRPIGAPCVTDDMCAGWTSSTPAGSLCVTGTCVHPAGYITGSQTCDPYIGPFCNNGQVCQSQSDGSLLCVNSVTPAEGSICDFSGGKCGGDGSLYCNPNILKCLSNSPVDFTYSTNTGAPVLYHSLIGDIIRTSGLNNLYFDTTATTGVYDVGRYSGADGIYVCTAKPTKCMATGYLAPDGTTFKTSLMGRPSLTTMPDCNAGDSFYANMIF